MFFYLSKVLELFIDPLIWVFVLLIMAYFKQEKGKAKRYLLGGILLLYLFSNRAIFHQINYQWEVQPPAKEQLDAKYDLVVVLGGLAAYDEEKSEIEFHGNADRIFKVLPLYFNDQVDKILLSGGSGKLIAEEKESMILADYLLSIGVKKEDLLLEDQSRNTFENAKYSADIIRQNHFEKVLLSTSAMHMNRAYLCFQKQGIEVIPFSTDRISYNRKLYFDYLFIPKTEVLSYWYWLLHEWVGLLTYKMLAYC